MVDPLNITDFNRSDRDLQEFAIFAICVAGKKAMSIAPRVSRLLAHLAAERPALKRPLPLEVVATFRKDVLARWLKRMGIGCYSQKAAALLSMSRRWLKGELDLRTCQASELESIPWVGAKTARFILMHSRPGVRAAAIDTHILKHLRANGVKTPKQTPAKGNTYDRLERHFLALADEAGMTPADYDLKVWKSYATN